MFLFTFSDYKTESKYCRMYALHERALLRLAMNILQDQGHAEDVVQECFAAMLENETLMRKFDDPDSPATKSYLMMMVKSRAINLYNKIKKQQNAVMDDEETLLYMIEDENADVEKILASAEMFTEASEYLKILDPLDINLMTLKYYKGFQNTEIADILGIDSNLVGVRLYRAKKKLAAEIERRNKQGDAKAHKTQSGKGAAERE